MLPSASAESGGKATSKLFARELDLPLLFDFFFLISYFCLASPESQAKLIDSPHLFLQFPPYLSLDLSL